METTSEVIPKKMSTRTKAALWVLIAPTAAIIASFILFAIVNFVFNPTMWMAADGEPLNATPLFITAANILLFIVGSLGVFAWFPGIIVGIVLLATKK